MSPLDESMSMENPLEAYLEKSQGFKIYTHSARTRAMILCVFLVYVVLFVFFLKFINQKIEGLDDLPEALALLSDPSMTETFFYLIGGLGLLVGMTILLYFIWNVVDIWGLQVWVSPLELRIQNTIAGPYFNKWTGSGSILMEDIVQLEGSRSATYVIGKDRRLRFSPVEKVDQLIAEILAHSKDVTIK